MMDGKLGDKWEKKILNEDSDVDEETAPEPIGEEEYKALFASDDDMEDIDKLRFSTNSLTR